MKYVVYINLDWLEMVFADRNITGEPEKQENYVEELRQQIADFIRKEEPGAFVSYSFLDTKGNEHYAVEIKQLVPTDVDPIHLPVSALEQLAKDGKVKDEARFEEDLNGDLLDCVELVMEFEKEFEISIKYEDAYKCKTVKDMYDLVEQAL